VAGARRELELAGLACDPDEARVTLHCDKKGTPRVLFVINATERGFSSRVGSVGARGAADLLDGSAFRSRAGRFDVELAPRSVRMLELEF